MTPDPIVERPNLPKGYGLPDSADGTLSWDEVETRLVASKSYWISTVRPDLRPHSVPRWGVWVDGRFWYDGSPETVHARNAEQNPWVTLTLESGSEVVIVEGESHATSAAADGFGQRLAVEFKKYTDDGYSPPADSWAGRDGGGLRFITPHRVLAWFDFPKDCTRFTFSVGESA